MKKIEFILELEEKIGLNKLFQFGLIPVEEIRNKDIYLQFDAYVKSGISKTNAKKKLSDMFSMDVRTIERIISKMVS